MSQFRAACATTILLSAMALSPLPAYAQAPAATPAAAPAAPQAAPTRAAGTLTVVEPGKLVLTNDMGTKTILLSEATKLQGVNPGTAADIKAGGYIGAGARPQADGTLNAVQIYIFPEAARGTAEGHRAWGVLPETTMTNATVDSAVSGVVGDVITLSYKDGKQKLRIVADSRILVAAPATTADLKPGTWVNAVGTLNPDGSIAAQRLTIGLKGAKPI